MRYHRAFAASVAAAALITPLLAASLSLQNLPAERGALRDAAVCEKPGFAAFGLFLPLH